MPDDATRALARGLLPLVTRVRTDVSAVRRRDGQQAWTREPLSLELLAQHLNGGPVRGVCPIKAGEDVTQVAVLDFDSHKGEVSWAEMGEVVARVAAALEAAGMAPMLFRSGGGHGVHLYLLWDSPQDAYSVRRFLRDVLESCGLKSGTGGVGKAQVEVFPKQDQVAADGFGNQFILPLARESVPLSIEEDLS